MMRTLLAASVLCVFASCRAQDRAPAADSALLTRAATRLVAKPPTADWRTFQGDGFTLRLPPSATADTGTSHPNELRGTAIHGPIVRDSTGQRGPAWRIVVVTQTNDQRVPLERWVDSVRNERNAASAGDPDSLAWLAAPDTVRIGSERGLRLQPFCGDCEAYETYAAAPGRIIVFAFIYDIGVPGSRDEQRAMYDAILATFRPNAGG